MRIESSPAIDYKWSHTLIDAHTHRQKLLCVCGCLWIENNLIKNTHVLCPGWWCPCLIAHRWTRFALDRWLATEWKKMGRERKLVFIEGYWWAVGGDHIHARFHCSLNRVKIFFFSAPFFAGGLSRNGVDSSCCGMTLTVPGCESMSKWLSLCEGIPSDTDTPWLTHSHYEEELRKWLGPQTHTHLPSKCIHGTSQQLSMSLPLPWAEVPLASSPTHYGASLYLCVSLECINGRV